MGSSVLAQANDADPAAVPSAATSTASAVATPAAAPSTLQEPGGADRAPNRAVGLPAAPALLVDEYRIGPHDLLEITVFQVADLSRTVRVNTKGMISMPLIGAIEAGGMTAQELEERIAERLAKDLLQDPQVSVFIKEYISQRVIIEGSVLKAGVYPITGRTTLLQAIAMASGLDPVANETEIKIFRQSPEGKREVGIYDIEKIRSGASEDPLIRGNDMIVVEKSGSRSAIKSVTDTIRGIFSIGVR